MKNIIFLLMISFSLNVTAQLNEFKEEKIFTSLASYQQMKMTIQNGDTTFYWQFPNWKYKSGTIGTTKRFKKKELIEFLNVCEDVIENNKIGTYIGFTLRSGAVNSAILVSNFEEIYVYKKHIKKIKKILGL